MTDWQRDRPTGSVESVRKSGIRVSPDRSAPRAPRAVNPSRKLRRFESFTRRHVLREALTSANAGQEFSAVHAAQPSGAPQRWAIDQLLREHRLRKRGAVRFQYVRPDVISIHLAPRPQGVESCVVGDGVSGFVGGRPGAHALVAVPVDGLEPPRVLTGEHG